MAQNTIPNTSTPLPTPWDLLQAGLSTGDFIRSRHGEQAYLDWLADGSPVFIATEPDGVAEDMGIVRRGWHGPYYKR
jgi:hypothetical protein